MHFRIKKYNKKRGIPTYLIILFFFIMFREALFYSIPALIDLYPYPITYYNKKDLCIIFVLLFAAITLIHNKKNTIRRKSYDAIVVYFVFMVAITSLISICVYEENIVSHIDKYYFYSCILLYFVLKFYFKKYDNFFYFFIKLFILIGCGYAISIIWAKIAYVNSGRMLFDSAVQLIQRRNGELRLQRPADFISLSAIFAFSLFCKERDSKRKTTYLIAVFICFFADVFVTKTRMYQLAIVGACLFGYLFNQKSVKKRTWIFASLLMIAIIAVPILIQFVSSFMDAENIGGTILRLEGYKYYLEHFFKNGIVGIGLISNDKYMPVLLGPGGGYGYYSLSDLGLIGFLGVFGLLGLVFLFFLIYLCIKSWKRETKTRSFQITKILIIYFAITSISLIFNDPQRAIYLPIYLSILNYTYENSKQDM